ncbi:MAG: metallophosphoesterase, partial [Polyangiales bacterium]
TDLEAYRDANVRAALARTLGVLSGDDLRVSFRARRGDHGIVWEDGELPFAADANVDVVPFSGGLDSFAGALGLVKAKRRVLLLSVFDSPRVAPHVRALADSLIARAPGRVAFVSASLSREIARESTRRTRSFVWAALGGALASAFGPKSALRYFENGVVSLGLPISAAALGARTSRAAHPQVLAGWSKLLSALADRTTSQPMIVDNGFSFTTKAEVVREVIGEPDLLRTVSCAKKTRKHCGLCAQCIDRRFATLAAKANEPASLYEVDLLTGERTGEARAIVEGYVRAATEIDRQNDEDFFARHGELARVLAHLPGKADAVASKLLDLHRRHAAEVEAVLDEGIAAHASELRKGTLPPACLLRMVLPSEPERPQPPRMPEPRAGEKKHPPPGAVRVLHISDVHFSQRRAWDQDPVLRALAEDVKKLPVAPDLVAITGDLADRGAEAEYAMAARWIREHLLPAARVTLDRVLIVPGNHDVDRSAVKRVAQVAQADLVRGESQDAIAAILSDPAERAPLLRRHDAFLAFLRELGHDVKLPWWSRTIAIGELRVHVAGISSSWAAWSDGDKGNLLVGRYQLHQVLEGAGSADLVLALVHHPWDYLADFDAAEVRETVQRRCHVILRGHLHKSDGAARVRPDGSLLELACGACYGGTTHPHGYQLIELEPAHGRARVHMRTWDGHDWIADRNAYRGEAPEGIAQLPLGATAGAHA